MKALCRLSKCTRYFYHVQLVRHLNRFTCILWHSNVNEVKTWHKVTVTYQRMCQNCEMRLALMCLRLLQMLWNAFVSFDCHFERNGNATASFNFVVIDCFDCENWHRQPINLRHITHYASLSFNANESEQNHKQTHVLSTRKCCRARAFVWKNAKWKLMEFVAKIQIQNHRTHAEPTNWNWNAFAHR